MSYTSIYVRINWVNRSTALLTPIDEINLNKMDYALKVLDDRTIELDTKKAEQSTVLDMVSDWTMDEKTGLITITKLNGEKVMFDMNLEKIPVNFSMSDDGVISMTTEDGSIFTADIGKMIPVLTFHNSDTIIVNVTGTGKNKTYNFEVKDGSITPEKLNPNYLAALKVSEENAKTNAESAATNAGSASKDAKDAKQYRDEAEQFKNQAFWGTPEGYEQLVDNVDDLIAKTDHSGITANASGEFIHLKDSTDSKAVEFALLGKATQKTTRGVNILDPSWFTSTQTTNGMSITNNGDNTWTFSGERTDASGNTGMMGRSFTADNTPEQFKKVGAYKLSLITPSDFAKTSNQFYYVNLYYNGTSHNNWLMSGTTEIAYMTEEMLSYEDFRVSGIGFYLTSARTFKTGTIGVQIEYGETATEFEQFTGCIPSPNPEYPQDITVSGADGSVEVKSLSNNIFNPAWLPTKTNNGVTFTNNGDSTFTFSGALTGENFGFVKQFTKDTCPEQFKKVGTYTLSLVGLALDSTSQNFFVNTYYNGASHNGAIDSGVNKYSFTITEEMLAYGDFYVNNIGFWFKPGKSLKTGTIGVQIEYGETATEFEQFKESTTTITTEGGLAGINGVCDEIVKYADGSGKHIQKIGKKTITSVSSKVASTKNNMFMVSVPDMKAPATNNDVKPLLCTHFEAKDSYTTLYNKNSAQITTHQNKYIILCFGLNENFDTVAEVNTWLATNNVTVLYELAEPIITDLSAEEIAELEVQTFYPTTNILNDANCGMEIEYVKDVFVTTQTLTIPSGNGGTTNYDVLNNKPLINGVELSGNKTLDNLGIQPKGDYLGKTSTVGFTQPSSRSNISSSDSITTMFGKISKWFADLKSVAFSGSYNDLSNKPAIPTVTNNLLSTVSGSALDATQGKILNDKIVNKPDIIFSTTEPTSVAENTIVMVYEE